MKVSPPTEKAEADEENTLPIEVLRPLEEIGVNIKDPAQVRQALLSINATASISRSPWPSADMLVEYREFDPDLPYRLIGELQTQAEHRRSLETKRTDGSEARLDRAQRNAFIIAVLGVLAGGGFSLLGAPLGLTMTIVIAAVGGPSTATVLARVIDKSKN